MGYKQGILSAGLALILAGCGQSGTQGPQAMGDANTATQQPEILGVVKVEFQHVGQPDFSVNATVLPGSMSTQTLARVGAVSFTQGARGVVSGPDGAQYLYGTLSVNNSGAARSNLTLLGINAKVPGGFQSLGDTSLTTAVRASGTPLTVLEARKLLPLNRRELVSGAVQVVTNQADFQAYREADLTPAIVNYMAASPYNGYAFPFGFVARSNTNARLIPSGSAAGTVTLAFRSQSENTTDTLRSFTWTGLIVADSENRVSTDAFETDTTRACAAVQSLYGRPTLLSLSAQSVVGNAPVTLATLRNVTSTDCAQPNTTAQDVSTVRTSGPAKAPTTLIPEQTVGGQVVAWGSNNYHQNEVPALPVGMTYTAVAAGGYHSLALRSDGQIVAWGDNDNGQTTVPTLPSGMRYTAVAAGGYHSLALRSDGQLVAWGDNDDGQVTVPTPPTGMSYTAVSAGALCSLALRSDGQLVAWGSNAYHQTEVPALPAGMSYAAAAGGGFHNLAVRSDGQLVGWGFNYFGQASVFAPPPTGLSYTAVAAGSHHNLALRSDGQILAWGDDRYNQLSVPGLPSGMTYTAVTAGGSHSVALRSDGQIVAWGLNNQGQINVPDLPAGKTYTAVAGGYAHNLAIVH